MDRIDWRQPLTFDAFVFECVSVEPMYDIEGMLEDDPMGALGTATDATLALVRRAAEKNVDIHNAQEQVYGDWIYQLGLMEWINADARTEFEGDEGLAEAKKIVVKEMRESDLEPDMTDQAVLDYAINVICLPEEAPVIGAWPLDEDDWADGQPRANAAFRRCIEWDKAGRP